MTERACRRLAMALVLAAAIPASARAAEPHAAAVECSGKENDSERLRCYDAHFRGAPAPAPAVAAARPAARQTAAADVPLADQPPSWNRPEGCPMPVGRRTHLEQSWALRDPCPVPLTEITWHRPTYGLILNVASDQNALPGSPTRGPAFAGPESYDDEELKFQFSLKWELFSGFFRKLRHEHLAAAPGLNRFLDRSRVWVAYTQQSHWQLYNQGTSRPFRETNYEPEVIWTYDNTAAKSALKLVNAGFVHQSNGRGGPQSRSWNRLYVQGGWDVNLPVLGDVSVLARKWWRTDGGGDDDNPDIKDYYGRADAVVRWEKGIHRVALLLRHTLRTNPGRGFAQIDYSVPVSRQRVHFQVSKGYGESLIDYNHNHWTVGVGLSIGEW